ncbi:MAG: DUF1805 domain-containing protein [Fervidicoccaceae archaeon]
MSGSLNNTSRVRLKSLEGELFGIEVDLPGSPPLVMVVGKRGFVACGLLDVSAAERVGAAAAKVVGVRSVEEMLDREIQAVTSRGRGLGLREGMRVREALELL